MNYAATRDKVAAKLKKAGAELLLSRFIGGEYDTATCRTAPATVMEYTCYGTIGDYKAIQYGTGAADGTLILTGDKKLLVSASADMPEPQAADTITAAGTIYKVVRTKTVDPAGIAVLYEVQARK